MSMLKNYKIVLWLIFIVLSFVMIGPNINPTGYKITSIDKNSPVKTLGIGDTVYKINDLIAGENDFSKNYSSTLKLDTNKGQKFITANGTLGLEVEKVSFSNLKLGLDIKGGVRAVLEPELNSPEIIEQTISTLQTRINVYGLRESIFRSIVYNDKGFVEISIAGGTKEELRSLLESQGKFEAKIPVLVKLKDGKGVIKLDKEYSINLQNDSVFIDDKLMDKNFTLYGINFEVSSIRPNQINLTSTVLTGNDIKTVFFDPQRSAVQNLGNSYQWFFAVQISQEGAQKFFYVVQNVPDGSFSSGESYLQSQISFYLDRNLIDSLNIGSSLKRNLATEITISGGASSLEEAAKVKNQLQSILRSGSLPSSIKIVSLETISPTLGSEFLRNALLAGLAAVLSVSVIIAVRYRRIKILFPILLISYTEILIIIGVYVLIGLTLDLPAIGGIIAAVGTGINDQIIIIDQALRKKEDELETMKEKMKKAFFVVFGAGGTIIAAMIPLTILGFGALRGFAITTIIGVVIGIGITRPAFGVLIEKLLRKSEME